MTKMTIIKKYDIMYWIIFGLYATISLPGHTLYLTRSSKMQTIQNRDDSYYLKQWPLKLPKYIKEFWVGHISFNFQLLLSQTDISK